MSFSRDIEKFIAKTELKMERTFRGIALDLFSKIILRTPVLSGRLVNNWFIGINYQSSETTEDTDKSRRAALKRSTDMTLKAKLGDSIYFVNNLEYADVIENGGVNRRPYGMVKRTVAEFKNVVKQNVSKNK